jgi:ActD protein
MSENSHLVCAVGSGTMPKKLYAVGAEFANPKELYAAAEKVRDRGFKGWDCYTPYYIHGLDKAMGLRKSFVGLFTFAGGLTGLTGGFLLITITSVFVYPIDTQGKPFFSLPGFVPILDLLMIILSAIMSIVGMTTLCLLPRLHHPLWEWDAFNRATHDKFFIVIEANDPRFNEKTAVDLLREIGGTNLTYIGDEE